MQAPTPTSAFLTSLLAIATTAQGQTIEARMVGRVTQELVGEPGDSGLEGIRVGDPLILVATIDLASAPDLLPETDVRATHVGPGVALQAQIGTVHLDLGAPEVMILGDISEFGGPIMDRLIIAGGVFDDPAPVYGVVNLSPDTIATDSVAAPFDSVAPTLQSSALSVTPYLGSLQGEVDRIIVRDVSCPADLVAPLGALDFSDIAAFLTAFAAGEPTADPAPPLGVHDFSDVAAFLGAFGVGCP